MRTLGAYNSVMELEPQNNTGEIIPELTVSMSRNHLLVNNRTLEPDDGPDQLHQALTKGRDVILHGLERYREQVIAQNPGAEVNLAPFTVMRINQHPKKVLSPLGLELKSRHEQVFSDVSTLRENFHPYWYAIQQAGFVPELRVYFLRSYDVAFWANIPPNNT